MQAAIFAELRRLANTVTLTIFLLVLSGLASAAEVDVTLSARESVVGAPLLLQVEIRDAESFQLPDPPEIAGLSIRQAGAPTRSSQTTIINGRSRFQQSVIVRYQVIAEREGNFTIPPLTVTADGEEIQTDPIQLVISNGQSGELLHLRVQAEMPHAYVGQVVPLTLTLWIRPYRDPEHDVTLSEGQMWGLISSATRWGIFSDRVETLRQNRRRPAGREVLRDGGDGKPRSYYEYEVQTEHVPTRPGQIEVDDIRVVVDYPTGIGRTRDRLNRMFGGDPFGASPLRQMLDDDFFGNAFGGLEVSASRPVVVTVPTGPIEVRPVPTRGRPEGYRGAVGRFRFRVQAEPTDVQADDPIQLIMTIEGEGALDRIQPPPLAKLKSLTDAFKLDDQPLAGVVREEKKWFVTTVRPRYQGVTQIPEIPFDYFDPETQSFETAWSDPIEVDVRPAAVLSTDSIMAGGSTPNRLDQTSSAESQPTPLAATAPDFRPPTSIGELLASHTGTITRPWLGGSLAWLVALPPLVWLASLIGAGLRTGDSKAVRWFGLLRQPEKLAGRRVRRAETMEEIERALLDFVNAVTPWQPERQAVSGSHDSERLRRRRLAAGSLRLGGLSMSAAQLELLLQRQGDDIDTIRQQAIQWIETTSRASRDRLQRPASRTSSKDPRSPASSSLAGLIFCSLLGWNATSSVAAESVSPKADSAERSTTATERSPLERIAAQALRDYETGMQRLEAEPALANDAFRRAADRLETIVASGVSNPSIWFFLGNAQFQAGQQGQAVASYQQSLRLDPGYVQARGNQQFVQSQLTPIEVSKSTSLRAPFLLVEGLDRSSWQVIGTAFRQINDGLYDRLAVWVNVETVWDVALVSWVALWSLAALAVWRKRPISSWSLTTAAVLLILIGMSARSYQTHRDRRAVVLAHRLELRVGDGDAFEIQTVLSNTAGHFARWTDRRGDWVLVSLSTGHRGWIRKQHVMPLGEPRPDQPSEASRMKPPRYEIPKQAPVDRVQPPRRLPIEPSESSRVTHQEPASVRQPRKFGGRCRHWAPNLLSRTTPRSHAAKAAHAAHAAADAGAEGVDHYLFRRFGGWADGKLLAAIQFDGEVVI